MRAAIIQPQLSITDVNRIVECASCGAQSSVYELAGSDGTCAKCHEQLCSFCGCTDRRACLHPDYGFPCSWYDAGVCDFCHWDIAEANFIAVTQGQASVSPFTPRLRPNVLPGSHLEQMQEVIRP